MLLHYFKTAWRNLIRNKVFSLVNIIGLSVGLACCLLISAYIYTELTYDRYAKDSMQIYRVELHVTRNGSVVDYPSVDVAVGKGMEAAFPGIHSYTRLVKYKPMFMRSKEKTLKETHLAAADANFLQVFSIPLVEGDEHTALQEPNTIVVTRAFARKYFGDEDPMGKTLLTQNNMVFKISGVIDKVPDKSHFHFDAFMSLATFHWAMTGYTWSNVGYYTYLVLNKNTDAKTLQSKFSQLVASHLVTEMQHDAGEDLAAARKSAAAFHFSLMPLTRIHLYSHTKSELESNGSIQRVYIFAALILSILLLACVNFINLSTASSFRRAREVGIRKALGSLKKQLIGQFLMESVLITSCATVLAFIFVLLALPYFNQLSVASIPAGFFLDYRTISLTFLLALLVGILAGIYPAFFLASFKPVRVLKGNLSSPRTGKGMLRSGLVVFQFVVSTCLIIATIIIYQQLHFMQNKKLGFDKDQVMVIQNLYTLGDHAQAFRERLLSNSRVVNATLSANVPGREDLRDYTQAYPEDKQSGEKHDEIHINIFHVDDDYIPTLGIKVIQGRNFSSDFPSDSSAVVINQTAAAAFGWSHTNAVGKYIVHSADMRFKVIGVVRDFNYVSVKEQIAPVMMMLGGNSGAMMVKVKTNNIPALLADTKKEWNALKPAGPFTYTFLDTKFASLYQSEKRTGRLFMLFAIVAIVIACLGLFGLATFTAYQRTKEIGIRKVVGASMMDITALLSRDFLKLVALSIVIAVPVAWWGMNSWLQNFAYRIGIAWWIFFLAAALAIFIALATVSFQAIRSAMAKPVKSLRME